MPTTSSPETKRRLASRLSHVRVRTFEMTDVLNEHDLTEQFSPLMSPLVWDMGHIANFEEFWLLRELDGRAAHDVERDAMYNPFDNPRWSRSDLPLLDRAEATEYLSEVRHDVDSLLSRSNLIDGHDLARDGYIFEMVVQHEAQHQETMLQALNLRPDLEAYALSAIRNVPDAHPVEDTARVTVGGGPFTLGTDDRAAAYDNERPAHQIHLDTFQIDRYPVTNRRYARFIESGGYNTEELWSSEGWEWRTSVDHDGPQGWDRGHDGWTQTVFGHKRRLDPAEPVVHVSYFEAEAFATFEGGRIPSEAQWAKAANWAPGATEPTRYPWGDAHPTATHANIGQSAWGTVPIGSYPNGASGYGVEQMLGDVYEWTSSPFRPYPGYSTFPYPEYSEVFFDDDNFRVLRGASWATSPSISRNSFRNWDYRERRQIFSGIRLVWGDAP